MRNNEQLKAIRRGEWTEDQLRTWCAEKESHLEKGATAAFQVVFLPAPVPSPSLEETRSSPSLYVVAMPFTATLLRCSHS